MSSVTAGPPAALPDQVVTAARSRPAVRRCGPLSLLTVGLLSVGASVFVTDWRVGVLAVAAQVLLLPLVLPRGGVRALLLRMTPVAIGAVSIGWSSWLLGERPSSTAAWEVGLANALRIWVLAAPGALLAAWIEPDDLGDHLAQRLRLPARVTVAVVAAMTRLSTFADVWQQLAGARRVRGLGPGRGPVSRARWFAGMTFALLVDALRRAARMSVAMDARGFATADRRTWARPAPWLRADTVAVVLGVALAAVPVVASVLLTQG